MSDLSQELDWDDEPELDPEEEYQTLVRSLRRTAGFGLFFVECSPAEGSRIVERVQKDLSQRVGELRLQDSVEDSNVFKRVKQTLAAQPVGVLFISGLEQLLYGYEETKRRLGWSEVEIHSNSWKDAPPVMVHLNQQREKFRDSFEARLVFLLPRFALKYVIARAPDFFDWRSGMFRCPIGDLEQLQQSLSNVVPDDLDYESLTPEKQREKLLGIEAILGEDRLPIGDRANLLLQQGLIFGIHKQYVEAIAVWTAAIDIKPDFHEALYNKGIALRKLGRYEEAIAAYDAALAIKPDKHEALNNKGNALDELGRYEEAIAAYDAALAIKPDKHEALNNKGLALYRINRFKEAIATFDTILTADPNYDSAIYNKACCYALWDIPDLALQQLEQAIALDPKYCEQAKTDKDFASLWDDDRFKAITQDPNAT